MAEGCARSVRSGGASFRRDGSRIYTLSSRNPASFSRRRVMRLLVVLSAVSLLVDGLATSVPRPPSTSSLDDDGGVKGGFTPPSCELFLHADGLGVRGSSIAFDFPVPDGSSRRLGTFGSFGGDSWSALSSYQGGRPGSFYRWCASRGVEFGVLTTKCVDDGTTSGLLVDVGDRYDLESVCSAISVLRPSPYLLSGGLSRVLFETTSRAVSSPSTGPPRSALSHLLGAYGVDERLRPLRASASRSVSSAVEFDTSGSTAFGETCEYPPASTFEERLARALEIPPSRGLGNFFLAAVYAEVDMASHSGDAARFERALATLRDALASATRAMASGCPGGWRMTVVGSHATGGGRENGTALHRHHSPAGTPVPVFRAESANASFASPLDEVEMFADALGISRARAGAAASATTRSFVRWVGREGRVVGGAAENRHHGVGYRDPHRRRYVTFWEAYFNVLLIVLVLCFVPCCACELVESNRTPRC